MYAVKYEQLEMVKYLTEKGANLNIKTLKGKSALYYAQKYKQYNNTKYLKPKMKE